MSKRKEIVIQKGTGCLGRDRLTGQKVMVNWEQRQIITDDLVNLNFVQQDYVAPKRKKRRTKQQIMDDMKVRCPKCKHEWYEVR